MDYMTSAPAIYRNPGSQQLRLAHPPGIPVTNALSEIDTQRVRSMSGAMIQRVTTYDGDVQSQRNARRSLLTRGPPDWKSYRLDFAKVLLLPGSKYGYGVHERVLLSKFHCRRHLPRKIPLSRQAYYSTYPMPFLSVDARTNAA